MSPHIKNSQSRVYGVKSGDLVYPKSQYHGWVPPAEEVTERVAIEKLIGSFHIGREETHRSATYVRQASLPDDFVSFTLSQFSIYRPESPHHIKTGWDRTTRDFEMEPLSLLNSNVGAPTFCFDGVLKHNGVSIYVKKVAFQILAIDGYGDKDVYSVREGIYIQTPLAKIHNIWYRLAEPSPEYRRFHDPFLWVADLAKHFVDFGLENDQIKIHDFRKKFYNWINRRGGSKVQKWLHQFGKTDFCTTVNANILFLWKECVDINPGSWNFRIWKEIHPKQLEAIEQQPSIEKRTVVTPFVFECFKHMYFSMFLEPRCPTKGAVIAAHKERLISHSFVLNSKKPCNTFHSEDLPIRPSDKVTKVSNAQVRVGDVIGIPRDSETVWKDKSDIWLAYVQGVQCTSKGDQYLHVIWLYRPQDTTLSTRYPIANELFFSDHCNCADARLYTKEITCSIDVEFFPKTLQSKSRYIVRQKYMTTDHAFATLTKKDFRCPCGSNTSGPSLLSDIAIGDAVLVHHSSGVLEPVIIVDVVRSSEEIMVREMLRRARDLKQESEPNELVWTNNVLIIPAKHVERKCHIRYMSRSKAVKLFPYNRKGSLDCFFFSTLLQEDGILVTMPPPELGSFHKAFAPIPSGMKPLAGLDLFCGGGNFALGLEELGAVKFVQAVDWDKAAVHTRYANIRNENETAIFFGSVNDYLAQAMIGSLSVARIGEIDFGSAGSPCPGFSTLQPNKQSDDSLRNASMVASVASFCDFYRPRHLILENVVPMAHKIARTDQNVLSQMLCALVGMGYQVRQFIADAWSFGECQSRSRLLIMATAPGYTLPELPNLTHAHPTGKGNETLGKGVNGTYFCERRFVPTPFPFTTAEEAFRDLPTIGDSRVQICVPAPDHRTTRIERPITRALINMVPVLPPQQNFVKAVRSGHMGKPQLERWWNTSNSGHKRAPNSKGWQRIVADKLVPTITTRQNPSDAFVGATIHWKDPRCLTVMEGRRAQGVPDDEVIVGHPAEQWKIVGNSVSRRTANASGLSFLRACIADYGKGRDIRKKQLNRHQGKGEGVLLQAVVVDNEDLERESYRTVSETEDVDSWNGCSIPTDVEEYHRIVLDGKAIVFNRKVTAAAPPPGKSFKGVFETEESPDPISLDQEPRYYSSTKGALQRSTQDPHLPSSSGSSADKPRPAPTGRMKELKRNEDGADEFSPVTPGRVNGIKRKADEFELPTPEFHARRPSLPSRARESEGEGETWFGKKAW
ncbi:S-adenosyl-L-methionine-dependent methyltransferase [Patellaria atrata CBS 101060]|uniref:DNA (cytosine-5-)-methyltransferase n=1 Tax=Patellaria atrata CBS 101060 TaxID=1346257 RepID=A0A9P4S3S8_9PEZI|nr:S-adenosyl-L-methionine-dependent methyltransferase [Patellaria atrata CBS 101060]